MKTRRALGFAFLAMVLSARGMPVMAYELITHAQISQAAYDVSVRVPVYLQAVAADHNQVFDPDDDRSATNFTHSFVNSGTVRDWFIAGAIREDDHRTGCEPPQNPPSEINRPLHHFFDPQRGGGFSFLGVPVGFRAPDWALGTQGRGPGPTENQFSVLDAREYQFRSLTEPTRQGRDRNTALLFRTLGHVAHLLQDMAQPQHTRNDRHSGCLGVLGGETSWFEIYVERRALGQTFLRRGDPAPLLALGGYAPAQFTRYRDLFTDGGGRGLADFSARNFLSAGTNLSLLSPVFGCGGLAAPPCNPDVYTPVDQAFSFRTIRDTSISGTVTLFQRHVDDAATGQTIPGVPLSSRSLWDQHLERLGFFPMFTLNTLNYDAMSDLLLPRAVGYSAALLDHFFRPAIRVKQIDTSSSCPGLCLVVENPGHQELDGVFDLYAVYDRGTPLERRQFFARLTSGGQARSVLPPSQGGQLARTFEAPVPPSHVPTLDYVLVFRGRHGEEADAVAGQVFAVPHALVIQDAYLAEMVGQCTRRDRPVDFLGSQGSTSRIESADLTCQWPARNHRVTGRIVTNASRPVIERIEAAWVFGGGPAPLVLDGVFYPGTWVRQGAEPDPRTFRIEDPAERGNGGLYLFVTLTGGRRIATSLASFGRSVSAHVKAIWLDDSGSGAMAYLVASTRSISASLSYDGLRDATDLAFFTATSVGGAVPPIDTVTFRPAFGSLRVGEGRRVTPFQYFDSVVDDYETFASGDEDGGTDDPGYIAAKQVFDAIEPLLDPQANTGPRVTWEAVAERVYGPGERALMRAVMTATPPAYTISIVGAQQ